MTVNENSRAFRWIGGTLQQLGTLGGDNSYAYDVSADGEVVVGSAQNSSGVWRAFRWRAGAMQDLGVLPQHPHASYEALAVSADGNIVVGAFGDYSNRRAFRWTPDGGMEDLNETYADALNGARLAEALAVSPDGKFIVGYGYRSAWSTYREAFLLDTRQLPRPRIESVTLQNDCQGPYFEGFAAANAVVVKISNWNGDQGVVRMRLPTGVVRTINATSNTITIPIDLGSDLVYPRGGGWCDVEITAYNAQGVLSETRVLKFYTVGLPPSLRPPAWLIPPEGVACNTSGKTRLRFLVKIPLSANNAIASVPARLPFMSDTKWGQRTEWFTAEVEVEANSMTFPNSQLQGTATLKVGRNISGEYQPQVRLPRNRVAIVNCDWEVGGGASGTFQLTPTFYLESLNLTTEARAGLETPNLLPILIATCCTPLTPLSEVAELYGRFNLGAAGSITLYDADAGLGFRESELNLSLGGELVLSTRRDWKDYVYLEGTAGVEPFIRLQFPGTPQNAASFRGVPYIRQVGISGFLRAKVCLLFLERTHDILSGHYVYPSDAMGMLGLPEWLQSGSHSGWQPMQRPYLYQGEYHKFVADSQFFPQNGGDDHTETILIQNLFPIAAPALTLYNGYPAIAYVHDDPNLPPHQMAEIRVLMQRPDDTWQNMVVTQDTALDSQPHLAVDANNKLVAVWMRMENVSDQPDPSLRLPKGEIAYAVYDATNGTWSAPALITQDTVLDARPRLVRGADGQLYLVWLKFPTNQFSVDLTQNPSIHSEIWVARWDGSAFVDVHRAIANADTLSAALVVDSNGKPTLVWSRYPDSRLFFSTLENGVWTTPTQVWSDSRPQSNPILTLDANNRPVLYFVRTVAHPQLEEYDQQELRVTDFTGGAWNTPVKILQVESLNDLQVVAGASGKVAVLWNRSSAGGVDVWSALYEPAIGHWSAPMRLTRDERTYEHQLSAVMDASETPIAVYLKRQQTQREETVEDDAGTPHTVTVTELGRADLALLRYTPSVDLTLERFRVDPPSASPGQTVELIAQLSNLRTKGAQNVAVRFYDGAPNAGGTAIGTVTATPNPLPGGGGGVARLSWTVPNDGRPRTLYALVDPDNTIPEVDESNNSASLPLAALDFAAGAPRLVQYLPNGGIEIQFVIENPSNVSPTGHLAWQLRQDSPTGAILAQGTVPAPAARQQVSLNHIWTPTTPGRYQLCLIVDPSNQYDESDEANNTAQGEIPLLPDLLLNPSMTEIERNAMQIQVRTVVHNRGGHDVGSFTVQALNGPPGVGSPLATHTISGLPRGGSRALSLQFTTAQRLSRVWLVIDADNAVQDANRANNLLILNLSWSEGDVNGDGCVDDADLLEVLFNFGQQDINLPADLNDDGVVDDADLLLTLFNFGAGCGG
ncbi:MAG: CARDB domain-containing protein [Fimbriimonadales bacterium]